MNRRGRPPHPDVLTPRQWQVLALLREGLSNEQIALCLGISIDGVKFHVSEILSKLGVGSRNEAARWDGEQRQLAPSARLAGLGRSARTSTPRHGEQARPLRHGESSISTTWRGGVQKRRCGAGRRCRVRRRVELAC